MAEFGLSKADRIRLSADYQRLKETGRRFRTQNFLVNYQFQEQGRMRLGVLVSKKMKKACARNRAKRLIREFFRLYRKQIKLWLKGVQSSNDFGLDLIVVAYPGAEELSLSQVKEELSLGFEKEAERMRKR